MAHVTTEDIMRDSPMKKMFKEKRQRKVTMARIKQSFWMMEDECNANVDNVMLFSAIS